MSKPWIWASIVPALVIVLLRSSDRITRRSLGWMVMVSLAVGAPLLYQSLVDYADAQVTWAPAFLPIPLKMASRIGLEEWFLARAGGQTALAALLATPIFLVGTIGARLVGVPVLWRSLRQRPGASQDAIWAVLAWTIVAAVLASSFIVSVPYHESQQIHQFALFLFAPFAGRAIASWRPAMRIAGSAAVIALAVPSTIQYLHQTWTDYRYPLVVSSRGEVRVASLLRATDPERTVILHDRPNDPFLPGVLAERRSVIAWAGYVRGNQPRQSDVEAFFSAPDLSKAREVLRSYAPTHIVERQRRDRLNPEVRAQLELVYQTGDVALYRVPDALRH
jgi:hypothetical protein